MAEAGAGEEGASARDGHQRLFAILEGAPPYDVWSPDARLEAASKLVDDPGTNGWGVLTKVIHRPAAQRADVETRALVVRLLVPRREVATFQLLLRDVAMADADPDVWRPALAAWLRTGDADAEPLTRSLLAAAESPDPETRSLALGMLHRAGPPGVEFALRLLADDGRSKNEESDLVASLVRAGRWDALLATPMSDSRASALVAALWEVVDDPELRAVLARRAADIPRPEDPESWCELLCQHLQRADVALAVARDSRCSVATRSAVLETALRTESCVPQAVAAACALLEDPAAPTELRRAVVDLLAWEDDEIVSVTALDTLRRVAASDPSAAIREAAAALVRDLTETE